MTVSAEAMTELEALLDARLRQGSTERTVGDVFRAAREMLEGEVNGPPGGD